MGLYLPTLQTDRLVIRPFTLDDLDAIHQILSLDLEYVEGAVPPATQEKRSNWLHWAVANYEALATLYQFPYGDRAAVLRETDQVIGSIGLVPTIYPFEQYEVYRRCSEGDSAASEPRAPSNFMIPEVGLFYAFARPFQRRGYATEAAQAMIDWGFNEFHLRRIVATTAYDNDASMGVMRKLGMTIDRNESADPPWAQVVAFLDNPVARS